jgi:hypothetical protein
MTMKTTHTIFFSALQIQSLFLLRGIRYVCYLSFRNSLPLLNLLNVDVEVVKIPTWIQKKRNPKTMMMRKSIPVAAGPAA